MPRQQTATFRRTCTFALVIALDTAALLAGSTASHAAYRAWDEAGIAPCATVREQGSPKACADGAGGVFVAWGERPGSADNSFYEIDTYITRIGPSGVTQPGWECRVVTTAAGTQLPVGVVPDGTGGVYILMEDDMGTQHREFHTRVQHLDAQGNPVPGWPPEGRLVSELASAQYYPEAIADGVGGLYVAWGDWRADGDTYAQRYMPDGAIAPGWISNGTPVDTAQGSSGLMVHRGTGSLALDPDGNLLIMTRSGRLGSSKPFLHKMLPTGQRASGWVENGKVVPTPRAGPWGAIASDGIGGAYVAWTDLRNWPQDGQLPFQWMDIYAHHVLVDGTLDPAWPLSGLPVCTLAGSQDYARLLADGLGGAFLVWEDGREPMPVLYVSRLTPSGVDPGYPTSGRRVADFGQILQHSAVLAPDGMHGLYVAFADDYYLSTHVQHLTAAGLPASGWPIGGMPATPNRTYGQWPWIASDSTGGVYVAWMAASDNIRMQRFVEDIATAITATLVLSEATPDRVSLAWQLGAELPTSLRVQRRSETEAWSTLAEVQPDGVGRVSYEDATVVSGGRYAYRLAWGDAGSGASFETWVDVPAAHRFALEGVRPNPATTAGRVHFSLDHAGQVTLEVLDLAGRRVGAYERTFEAGRHSLPLGELARPSPGIYWLRLTHEGRVLTNRAVVMN